MPSSQAKWPNKFCYLNCKNLDDQARLGMPQSIDSKAVLEAILANIPLEEYFAELGI